jgi:hypothetical protein
MARCRDADVTLAWTACQHDGPAMEHHGTSSPPRTVASTRKPTPARIRARPVSGGYGSAGPSPSNWPTTADGSCTTTADC